ncbi:MAG: hypothetical protein R2737_15100 [Candidatus Nanopelagicales bacterium]
MTIPGAVQGGAGCVVLCPPAPGAPPYDRASVAAALAAAGIAVLAPDVPDLEDEVAERGIAVATAHWVAELAVALGSARPAEPVLLVAHGAGGPMLPALGFSQRAARRSVCGYVLVDGTLPRHGIAPDWPDAPVVALVSTSASDEVRAEALQARLRGWEVVEDADVPAAVVAVARR